MPPVNDLPESVVTVAFILTALSSGIFYSLVMSGAAEFLLLAAGGAVALYLIILIYDRLDAWKAEREG